MPVGVIMVHHGPVAKAFRHPGWKIQATGGSASIKIAYQPVRQLGADARETLRAAAAVEIEMRDGRVHWQGKSHVYGDFAELASTQEPASDSALKLVAEFKAIGTSHPRLETQRRHWRCPVLNRWSPFLMAPRSLLKLDWELPQPLAQFSSDSAYNSFEAAVAPGSGEKAQETGEGAGPLDKAARIVEADYWAVGILSLSVLMVGSSRPRACACGTPVAS